MLLVQFHSRSRWKHIRAYLRQKIVDAYADGNISQPQLAKRFRVALSFIEKLLKQYRETGTIAPKIRVRQTPTKLNVQQLSVFASIVETNNDATLEELRTLLQQQTGVLISRSTVELDVAKTQPYCKKKHSSPQKNRAHECNSNEYNFGN